MDTMAESAVRKMHAGMPAALAIWKTARECGVSTGTVAAGIPHRRRPVKRIGRAPAPVPNAWWNN